MRQFSYQQQKNCMTSSKSFEIITLTYALFGSKVLKQQKNFVLTAHMILIIHEYAGTTQTK